jgi:hypothetical protein
MTAMMPAKGNPKQRFDHVLTNQLSEALRQTIHREDKYVFIIIYHHGGTHLHVRSHDCIERVMNGIINGDRIGEDNMAEIQKFGDSMIMIPTIMMVGIIIIACIFVSYCYCSLYYS